MISNELTVKKSVLVIVLTDDNFFFQGIKHLSTEASFTHLHFDDEGLNTFNLASLYSTVHLVIDCAIFKYGKWSAYLRAMKRLRLSKRIWISDIKEWRLWPLDYDNDYSIYANQNIERIKSLTHKILNGRGGNLKIRRPNLKGEVCFYLKLILNGCGVHSVSTMSGRSEKLIYNYRSKVKVAFGFKTYHSMVCTYINNAEVFNDEWYKKTIYDKGIFCIK